MSNENVVKYKDGSDKIKALVAEIVDQHHPDLRDAKIRVIEASKMHDDSPVKMSLATPGDKVDGYDLVLIYHGGVLLHATEQIQKALTDNGLSGWAGVEKRGRKGAPSRTGYVPKKPLKLH